MAHSNSEKKQHHLELIALPYGGYVVSQGLYGDGIDRANCYGHFRQQLAAFSKLIDALDWMAANAAEPVSARK
jgi:hypothetical protein